MSFKSLHVVPYFIPLGSPLPLEGLGEVFNLPKSLNVTTSYVSSLNWAIRYMNVLR